MIAGHDNNRDHSAEAAFEAMFGDYDGMVFDAEGFAAPEAVTEQCGVTVLRTMGGSLFATKKWVWNPHLEQWKKESYSAGSHFRATEHPVASLADLFNVLEDIRHDPCAVVVRGALSPEIRAKIAQTPGLVIRRNKHAKRGGIPSLMEVDRRWIMADVDDGWPLPSWADLADDPETVIDAVIHDLLPEPFHDADCYWQLSSSAGIVPDVLKCHLWFWLSAPASNTHVKAVLKQCAPSICRSPFNAAQPHYIADPVFEGRHDPLPRRTGWRGGLERAVELPALRVAAQPARAASMPNGGAYQGGEGVAGALALLGDGDGLDGFHAPLLAATMRYARQCARFGTRDDAALKAEIRAAIAAAPTRAGRTTNEYVADAYLDRIIDGAFTRAADDDAIPPMAPHHAAPTHTVDEARAVVAE